MEGLGKTESFIDKTTREMSEKSFEFVGSESLGRDKFDSETAMFLPVIDQTKESIKEKYSENGKQEVELIQTPNDKIQDMIRKGIITEEEGSQLEIPEAEKSFLVFRKRKL